MRQYSHKSYLSNLILGVLISIFTGAVTGVLIFFFKYVSKHIEEISEHLYQISLTSPFRITVIFIMLIILAVLMYYLHKIVPESRGGGIPRSEGVLKGILKLRPLRTLLATISGTFISLFAGIPVDTEGPAILAGTAMGDICKKITKKRGLDRYIKTSGAAAGFAVATGAPFTGILFTLEEVHKRFTPMLVATVSMAILSAYMVNEGLCTLFNMSPRLFEFELFTAFKIEHFGYLVLLGVLVALLVGAFDKTIHLVKKFTSKHTIIFHPVIKLIILFVISGILCLTFADAAYSGHRVVENMLVNNNSVLFLLLLLVVRLIMMYLVTDSNVTGGICIPTFAIATIIGALLGKLLILIGLDPIYFPVIVILTMTAFIGGVLRAPFTAAIWFIELTFCFTDLIYVIAVIFIVNFITEIFHQPPLYEATLEELEEEQNGGKHPVISHFEIKVSPTSIVVGKAVRDIMWPHSSVVLSVQRHQSDIIDMDNDGEKKLYPNDTLEIRCRYFDIDQIKKELESLVGNDFPIKIIEK